MKRLLGWFVVLLILSTGVTIWWRFGGSEVVASLNVLKPELSEEDLVDHLAFDDLDISLSASSYKDPKEVLPKAEEQDAVMVVATYDPLVEYRLARDLARENAQFGLEKLAKAGNQDASLELLDQTKNVKKEEELEGMLKAKGFGDTVISIEETLVKVIARNLTKEKVEAIGEIIYTMTNFGREQIVLSSI